MTTPKPMIEQRLVALLDAIDEPVSIGSAIRDRDGRIRDFRIEFVNHAVARWSGVPREAMVGLITGELMAELRSSGLFDKLREVVDRPAVLPGGRPGADAAMGGAWVGGIYDLRAIRLGDGYLSTWRQRTASPEPG